MTSKRKPSMLDKYTTPAQLRHALASVDLPGANAPVFNALSQSAPAAAPPRQIPGFVFDPATNRYFRVSEAKKLRPPPAVQERLAVAAASERAAKTAPPAAPMSARQPRPNLLAQLDAARSVGGRRHICPSSSWRRLVARPDLVPLSANQGIS
jgi:hypothetical protein